jgi:hypothetical protein
MSSPRRFQGGKDQAIRYSSIYLLYPRAKAIAYCSGKKQKIADPKPNALNEEGKWLADETDIPSQRRLTISKIGGGYVTNARVHAPLIPSAFAYCYKTQRVVGLISDDEREWV